MVQEKNINVVNNNGNFKFTNTGDFTSENQKTNIFSNNLLNLTSKNDTMFHSSEGDLIIKDTSKSIKLEAESDLANAILLNASGTNGGIKVVNGLNGFDLDSTGNVDIFSQSSNINIGVPPEGTSSSNMTQNLKLESFKEITCTTEDMLISTTDLISFVSQSGNVQFGSDVNNPVIKFEKDNLIVNQFTSSLDRQLDIAVKDASSERNGYNGIIVNSSNTSVAADIECRTSDKLGRLSLGVEPSSSNYSYNNECLALQYQNSVIPVSGLNFSSSDIGKKIYWDSTQRTDTISAISSNISIPSNTTISVSGTYSGTTTKNYLLEIDSTGTPNTFKWSNNAGNEFQQEYIPITSTSSTISLDNGLSVQFSINTGLPLRQQFTFNATITATVSNNSSIDTPETLYILQPYHSYINNITDTDLVIKTNNNEKMRITGDGAISIQKKIPTSSFHINSNYNRTLHVNQAISGYQINPSITSLRSGGYIIVWESQNTDGSGYGIYGQRYQTDGSRYGINFKVNVNTTNNQSMPFVAFRNISESNNYIVVWSDNSDSTSNYDIYAQIYQNNSPIVNYDILINNTAQSGDSTRNNNQLYPAAVGLTNGNYVIVWASDDTGDGNMNIYFKIIDNNGNLLISKTQANTTTTRSQNFPAIAALSDNDPNSAGGFVIGFLSEMSTDDNRFTVKFRVFNSNGSAYGSEVNVTTTSDASISSISDGLLSMESVYDGGFLISFYRNYEADTSFYNDSDNIIGSISGTTGTIKSGGRDNTNNIIQLRSLSGRLLQGEEIVISSSVSGIGNVTEKILSITYDTESTANITLDTGYKQVSIYKFNSNATSVDNAVWISKANSSKLYEDADRSSITTVNTRGESIFNFRRPKSSITSDQSVCIVVWSNGSIPSIYYQLLNISDGSLIGSETQISNNYNGLKQRNPVVSKLNSIQGNNYGFVVTWDNQSLDLSQSGIYQQLIAHDYSIFKLENGTSSLQLEHNGKLGLGTSTPSSTFHIKSNQPSNHNSFNNTAAITIQNTGTHKILDNDQQKIEFMDGNGNILNQIKSTYALSYNDLNPAFGNLIGFYKFNHSEGTQVVDSSSANVITNSITTNLILVNFDTEICWQKGLIDNCLSFNGINNYVFLHNDAGNNVNKILSTASLSVSIWINVNSHIINGSTYDIISNYDDASAISDISGLFIVSIIDSGNDGNMKLKTQARSSSATGTVTGTITVNTNSWVLLTVVITRDSSGSNNTINQYVNGNLDGTTTFSGIINAGTGLSEQTVYVGSKNTSGSFFRGKMNHLRIYNLSLTSSQISEIYSNGNDNKGNLIITPLGKSNNTSLKNSIIIDDDGNLNNLSGKPMIYKVLSGTITGYNSNVDIKGTNTLFTNEIKSGDMINFNSGDFLVTQVVDNTSLKINEIPLVSDSSLSEQSVLVKSSIFSGFDNNNNLVNIIDNHGNMGIGNLKPNTNLEISGTGDSNDLPYITLTNKTLEDTDGGRETKLLFRGNYNSRYTELGSIEVAHSGSSNDKRGIMKFKVNDGFDTSNISLSITSNGNIGIGNQLNPKSLFHLRKESSDCQMIMQAGGENTSFFSEKSQIFFGGETTMNDDTSSLTSNCLASVMGSGDSTSKNFDGRLDFLTNNNERDLGLEKRMVINSQGKVGVSVYQPTNIFQVSPEIRKANFGISTITNIATQTITLSDALFTTTEIQNKILGGVVIINNENLTKHNITAVPANNKLTLDGTLTGNTGKQIYVHYPGLNVKSDGLVGIGNINPSSMLQCNGSLSLPIETISTDTTLTIMNYTVIVNTNGGVVNVTLPNNSSSLKGRIYVIKRVGSNTLNILTQDSANIDGSSTKSITTNYNFITVQSDGTDWYIISE
tara:strand:- start:618 stop:6194 length:5577 start_codon:yes stop_codon:yes gene_type:complete